ncbi:MAG: hypothetical protein JW704_11295 [Anaerolineaceae bacterium]|nr:hypothetical protein [Anaerolineaceae bacterium]
MKVEEIKKGVTYVGVNGKCVLVIGINQGYRPEYACREEPGVLFRKESGEYGKMYLSSFANLMKKRYNG